MNIFLRTFQFTSIFILFILQPVFADVTRLPADALAALNKPADFIVIKKTVQIPKEGRLAFNKSTTSDDIHMADPGDNFQVTDVVMPGKVLPYRQLQFAAQSKEYLLIHHATGGIAFGYYFVLLKKNGDHFNVIWIATSHTPATNFQEFLSLIKANKIEDRYDSHY